MSTRVFGFQFRRSARPRPDYAFEQIMLPLRSVTEVEAQLDQLGLIIGTMLMTIRSGKGRAVVDTQNLIIKKDDVIRVFAPREPVHLQAGEA